MKNYILLLLYVMISGCVSKPPALDCEELNSIKAQIKQYYQADQVEVTSKVFKEEMYFDEIRSIYITLYNPTTEALEFKSLPTDKYQRFENYEKIQKGLEKEGEAVLNLIKESCNLRDFNEVIIVFGKRGENDPLLYDFNVHYKI